MSGMPLSGKHYVNKRVNFETNIFWDAIHCDKTAKHVLDKAYFQEPFIH